MPIGYWADEVDEAVSVGGGPNGGLLPGSPSLTEELERGVSVEEIVVSLVVIEALDGGGPTVIEISYDPSGPTDRREILTDASTGIWQGLKVSGWLTMQEHHDSGKLQIIWIARIRQAKEPCLSRIPCIVIPMEQAPRHIPESVHLSGFVWLSERNK